MADDKIKILTKYKAVIFAAIPLVILALTYFCTSFIVGSAFPSDWSKDDRAGMIFAWLLFTVIGELIAWLINEEI